MSVFDAVRDIPARDAAERAGLAMQPRGARSWARCPASGERTASLCLYPDSGWHCFSCNAGGDSSALYAHIFGLSPLDAARRLAEDFNIQTDGKLSKPQKPTIWNLRRGLEDYRKKMIRERRDAYNLASAVARGRAAISGADAWDEPNFVQAVEAMGAAINEIEQLEAATLEELVEDWIGE